MHKGAKILALLFIVSWANGYSQQLSHQVMVPAAGIATTRTVNYSQTIGETAIEIIGGSGFVFTQGFQQPGIKFSHEIAPEGNGVDVYPNPAVDFINVKFFGDVSRKFTVDIINIAGTILRSSSINFITSYYYIQQVEINSLKKGFYFVKIVSDDGVINRVFKIEKL